MAGGKRPAPFRTRKLSRLCADGTATGGSWESKTLPQSTVSWGWGTGLETGTYPTPPLLRAHTTRTHVCAHSRHCPSLTSEMHLSDWLSAPKKSPPHARGGGSHRRADVFDCQVMTYLRRVTRTVPIAIAARLAIARAEFKPVVARCEGRSEAAP